MYFSQMDLQKKMDMLKTSTDRKASVKQLLTECGFEVTEFDNGTIFALLLGDMPSKEGSVFVTSCDQLAASAELCALAEHMTRPCEDYKSRLHHPDLELVFLADWNKDCAPNFMKIYSPNAYLLENDDRLGTLLYTSDPIVAERYQISVEGLGNAFTDKHAEQSEMNRLFSEKEIRAVSFSSGAEPEEYAKNADILLYLAVAYQE